MKGDIGIRMHSHTLRTRRDTVPRNQPYHYKTTFTQSEVDLAGKFDEIYVFAERCCFCLVRSTKNDSLFLGHIALSQPILKIMS